jgi:hypothetical protein
MEWWGGGIKLKVLVGCDCTGGGGGGGDLLKATVVCNSFTVVRRSVHHALGLCDRLEVRKRRRHDLTVAQR